MIKNAFVTFIILLFTANTTLAQVPRFTLETDLLSSQREDLVTKPKSVTLVIQERFRPEAFIDKGMPAPYQGYVLKISDRNIIENIVKGCQSSCGALVESINETCKQTLTKCQKDCDDRIKLISDRNDQLVLSAKQLEEELKSESRKKIIFTSIATFAGMGIGALIVNILN